MNNTVKQILSDTLQHIENITGKMYTISLHTCGDWGSNDDIVVGKMGERKYKWKVEINSTRKKLSYEHQQRYDSIDDMKIDYEQEVPVEKEMFELNGVYDSFDDIKKKLNGPFCNRLRILPYESTKIELSNLYISEESLSIYHSSGGSLSIATMIGKIIPVKEDKKCDIFAEEDLKERVYASC